jgi:hypothetical protein
VSVVKTASIEGVAEFRAFFDGVLMVECGVLTVDFRVAKFFHFFEIFLSDSQSGGLCGFAL